MVYIPFIFYTWVSNSKILPAILSSSITSFWLLFFWNSYWPSIGISYTIHLEKAMATHFSTLACKIPWTEEPGGLQSMGSLRVEHNWATSLSRIGEGNGNPLKCSCLENPRDGGAWWAAIYGVAQSRTRLKRLSSSSSSGMAIFKPHTQSSEQFFNALSNVSW